MNAHDAAGVAALTIIVVPLLMAMGASMKPERRRQSTEAKSHEQVLQDDTAPEERQRPAEPGA